MEPNILQYILPDFIKTAYLTLHKINKLRRISTQSKIRQDLLIISIFLLMLSLLKINLNQISSFIQNHIKHD
jgi:hypothetical protein